MTQQQIVREFEKFSKTEKSVIIRKLLQIFEQDLSREKLSGENFDKSFTITPLKLKPKKGVDFDNIGKLIEEIEGDFYK